ncbi:hypothetical protein ABW21_db0208880 [Orbilia brochopaga]|nr:hypothetical protein ABW21_db0208880 [Drechslerella brochopaga]
MSTPPLKIPKPRGLGGGSHITKKWIQANVFNNSYLCSLTGNWVTINFNSILSIIRDCAWRALQKDPSFDYSTSFTHIQEDLIRKIYDAFENELREWPIDPSYRAIVNALLESTKNLDRDSDFRDRRWFFIWVLRETIRSKKKARNREAEKCKWDGEESHSPENEPLALDTRSKSEGPRAGTDLDEDSGTPTTRKRKFLSIQDC